VLSGGIIGGVIGALLIVGLIFYCLAGRKTKPNQMKANEMTDWIASNKGDFNLNPNVSNDDNISSHSSSRQGSQNRPLSIFLGYDNFFSDSKTTINSPIGGGRSLSVPDKLKIKPNDLRSLSTNGQTESNTV
jgi:hypothetical protein